MGRWGSVPADAFVAGLWDVEGEVENLSAKVVNLFLVSSFSGKKKQGNSLSAAPVA